MIAYAPSAAPSSLAFDVDDLSTRMDDALERAVLMTDAAEGFSEEIGGGGVLVTGSVVTVGEARVLLGGPLT